MNKIYYVVIKGRTLESRDLKELLARAVNEKRNQDRKVLLQARMNASDPRGNTCQAAAV
jgi:hypothetical protein